jgi:hypothetical protein
MFCIHVSSSVLETWSFAFVFVYTTQTENPKCSSVKIFLSNFFDCECLENQKMHTPEKYCILSACKFSERIQYIFSSEKSHKMTKPRFQCPAHYRSPTIKSRFVIFTESKYNIFHSENVHTLRLQYCFQRLKMASM